MPVFSVELTTEELMNLDIDLKALITGPDRLYTRKFKFSTLAKKKRGPKPKIKPESETTN